MVKTKFKKAVSLMLAAVMSLTAFMGIGATTAFAAVGEKADVYLVDYPRSGDTNNNGEWGHGNLNYMNGWKGLSTKYTGLRAMGSYSGNIAYCIEPGTGQRTGDTLTEKDENFFNNISPNGTISGDDIRLLIGRILQYGYRGGISTSWKSQNTTKTPAGRRKVPMLGFVKEAFLMEKERQELLDLHCEATVDGYTDFIFINRFGQPQHQATLNKAIRRIIRDCNDEQLLKDENAEVLLPHFSCHSLRHTFTTRMCEAGVNVKVIQDTLGHKDISTTLNIYTDVTKELRKSEFECRFVKHIGQRTH